VNDSNAATLCLLVISQFLEMLAQRKEKGLLKVQRKDGKMYIFISLFSRGEGGLLVLHSCLSVCSSILGDILFLEAA
jgi:hypothetical protein